MSQFVKCYRSEQWEARIERVGRWTWSVTFTKGLTTFMYPDTVLGSEERAQRHAQRKLVKLRRRDQWHDSARTIA